MVTRRHLRKGSVLLGVVMLVAYAAMALYYLRHAPRNASRLTTTTLSNGYYGQGVTTLTSYCPPGRKSRRGGDCSDCDAGYGYVSYVPAYNSGYMNTGNNCPGGVCPTNTTDGYTWGSEHQGYIPLFLNGRQVGGYYVSGFWQGQYLGFNNGRWDNIDSDLPVNLPAQYQQSYRGRVGSNGNKPAEQKTKPQQQQTNPPPQTNDPTTPATPSVGQVGASDEVKKQLAQLTEAVNALKKASENKLVKQESAPKEGSGQELTGVDVEGMKRDKMEAGTTINGRKSTEKMAYNLLERNGWAGSGDIPDFTGMSRITIVGSEDQRNEAKRLIKEMFPSGIEGVIVQEFDPSETAMLRQVGFPIEGAPAIAFQLPKGDIAWRLVSTTGLQSRLAQLRRPNDGYRPDRDPVGPPLFADETSVAPILVGGLAGMIALAFIVAIIINMLRQPPTENRQWHGSGF